MGSGRVLTPEIPVHTPDFNQSPLRNFQSRSAQKISITIRLKKENQSPIDPELFFDRDRDRV
jgi:hypothetical protein